MPTRESTPYEQRHAIAWNLAEAMTAGPWQVDELILRAAAALGEHPRWLDPMADRLARDFSIRARPTARAVVSWVLVDRGFRAACKRRNLPVAYTLWPAPAMHAAPGPPQEWAVPAIETPMALARFLGLTPGELDWFAELQGRAIRRKEGPLQHYRYHWQAKRTGSSRLIEAPKARLKAMQRELLASIVSKIPPHDAAHGFRVGRSVMTYVAPHVGRRVVLKLDLEDFFATIHRCRIAAIFRTAGYPEAVAQLLAGLCTNRAPRSVWENRSETSQGPDLWRARRLYETSHLPQGAPTSPGLANLAAYRLDLRLTALAESAGACYTRYADDLAFSGARDFERAVKRFQNHAFAIAIEEGFAIQPRKTRVMRQSVRQRVAGVVLNERPNIARADYDCLKAILHNCVLHGPAGQNRDGHPDFRAHLAGRVAHVAAVHPERGRRLKEIFDQIAW